MLTNLQRAFIIGLAVTCFVVGKVKADATLTCTLTGAGAANANSVLVISDADGGRVLNYVKAKFTAVPPLTNSQAVKAALDELLASIRTGVTDFERNSAIIQPVTPK